MSLQDIYNQSIQEQKARKKAEEEAGAKEALLCGEVLRINGGRGTLYDRTLPVSLAPEMEKLVQELIALCPAQAWKRPPEKLDTADIHLGRGIKNHSTGVHLPDSFHYETGKYDFHFGQYRLADGSVHIGFWNLVMKKEVAGELKIPFRFTRKGKAEAFEAAKRAREEQVKAAFQREIQEQLDRCAQSPQRTGAREYLAFWYRNSLYESDSYSVRLENILAVFRDGTVYDPWQDYRSPLAGDDAPAKLASLCERQVKEWAKLS